MSRPQSTPQSRRVALTRMDVMTGRQLWDEVIADDMCALVDFCLLLRDFALVVETTESTPDHLKALARNVRRGEWTP